MGTRHLCMVIESKKPVIAQYGQWDGYPGGQGIDILRFLKQMDKEKFINQLKKCVFSDEEREKQIEEAVVSITGKNDGWMTMEESRKFHALYPYLNRDLGAEILTLVYDSPEEETEILLKNNANFAADSLWCEYAYVIDLDKNTFEVYEGFNDKKLNEDERFYELQQKLITENKIKDYYPVKTKKIFNLDELPETEDDFLVFFNEEEED